MRIVAILLTLIVLAAPGCKGEGVPKPKTDAALQLTASGPDRSVPFERRSGGAVELSHPFDP